MPDILIRGMEMPSELTAVWVYPDGQTIVFKDNGNAKYRTKAIELPPHGDLIDRDSLKEVWEKELPALLGEQYETADMGEIHKSYIEELGFRPVVVPADKEDT